MPILHSWKVIALSCCIVATTVMIGSRYIARPVLAHSIKVEIANPTNIPILVSDAEISNVGGQDIVRVKVFNAAPSRLLSLQLNWEAKLTDGRSTVATNDVDFLFSQQEYLQPGQWETETFRVPKFGRADVQVAAVVASITFVEFSTGVQLGVRKNEFNQWLNENRQLRMAEYKRLYAAYRAGGEQELEAALSIPDSKLPPITPAYLTRDRQLVRLELQQLQKRSGLAAVVALLRRVSTIKLPE